MIVWARIVLMLCAVLGLELAPAGAALAQDGPCGVVDVAPEALDAIQTAADAELEEDEGWEEGEKADGWEEDGVAMVEVYVHVVRMAPGGEGDMPVERARGMIVDVLNDVFAYQDVPFVFELAGIDYITADSETYHLEQGSDRERALYDLANVAGATRMNVYVVGPRAGTSVTGWAEFLVNPALHRGDHVVVRYFPDRGGLSDPLVIVHETGHWLGLLHTFHFGCGALRNGDLIWDTPTQATGHHLCGSDVDTCPDDWGNDPVENVMGYSNECRGLFTEGQKSRMRFLWRWARGGKADGETSIGRADPSQTSGCCAVPARSGRGVGVAGALIVLACLRRRVRTAGSGRR